MLSGEFPCILFFVGLKPFRCAAQTIVGLSDFRMGKGVIVVMGEIDVGETALAVGGTPPVHQATGTHPSSQRLPPTSGQWFLTEGEYRLPLSTSYSVDDVHQALIT